MNSGAIVVVNPIVVVIGGRRVGKVGKGRVIGLGVVIGILVVDGKVMVGNNVGNVNKGGVVLIGEVGENVIVLGGSVLIPGIVTVVNIVVVTIRSGVKVGKDNGGKIVDEETVVGIELPDAVVGSKVTVTVGETEAPVIVVESTVAGSVDDIIPVGPAVVDKDNTVVDIGSIDVTVGKIVVPMGVTDVGTNVEPGDVIEVGAIVDPADVIDVGINVEPVGITDGGALEDEIGVIGVVRVGGTKGRFEGNGGMEALGESVAIGAKGGTGLGNAVELDGNLIVPFRI